MSSDKKDERREFSCGAELWSAFEELADEMGCSVDHLLGEAMRRYHGDQVKEVSQPADCPHCGSSRVVAGSPRWRCEECQRSWG
jgi:hypothetical protein